MNIINSLQHFAATVYMDYFFNITPIKCPGKESFLTATLSVFVWINYAGNIMVLWYYKNPMVSCYATKLHILQVEKKLGIIMPQGKSVG